jgi:hypothetical protein
MKHLHYVTLGRDEDLLAAFNRWQATRPASALNVFCYRIGDGRAPAVAATPRRHSVRPAVRRHVRRPHQARQRPATVSAVA